MPHTCDEMPDRVALGMPLATICGFPAAGKTQFAIGLVDYLRKSFPGGRVVLINEEELHIPKAEGYRDATAEKITRGSLKAKVDQSLNVDTVVVLDSMNYIKGFRYELHCSARQENTQHCVVWVQTEPEKAAEWNASRPEAEAYPPELLDDLTRRFEPPDERNRWDRPLIRVSPVAVAATVAGGDIGGGVEEGAGASSEEEAGSESPSGGVSLEQVYQQVVDALVEGRAPTAGLATQVVVRGQADALYEMDQVTQRILASVMERAPSAGIGERVMVEGSSKPVVLGRRVSPAELKRLRRQFFKQAVALETAGEIAETFVEFLNTNIG